MSAQALQEFFVKLGFEVDSSAIDEFEQKLAGARSTVLAVGGITTAAAGAIGLFVTKVAEGIDDLGDFAEGQQASIEALQELGYAAKLRGSDLEAVKASVAGVNKTIGEAVLGIGRGAQTFQKLGMEAKNADGSVKTFDQLMTEVGDKFVGLSRQEQIALAEKLGINSSLVTLLNEGTAGIEALREEARAFGVVSEEDAQKAGLLTDSLDRIKFLIGSLGKTIAVGFMPAVTEVIDGTRQWLLANAQMVKSGITGFLKTMTAIVGTMWDWLVRLVRGLMDAVHWMTQFRVVVYLAAAALGTLVSVQAFGFFAQLSSEVLRLTRRMAAFNATALIIPAIIGAIILAIGLLVDDYVNWKEGNDSVIGGLIEQFPMLLEFIKTIEQFVGALADFWMEQWDKLQGPLMDLGASLWRLVVVIAQTLWPVLRMVFMGWGYILAGVIPIIARLIGFIADGLVSAIAGLIEAGTWLADVFASFFGAIRTGFEFVSGVIDSVTNRVMRFIDMVTGAVGAVGNLLGLSGNSTVSTAAAQAPAIRTAGAGRYESTPWATGGGVIGSAGNSTNSTSSVTQTTQITGTRIEINSPDPAKAGEAVRQELERMNKQTVRNGQTAVAL